MGTHIEHPIDSSSPSTVGAEFYSLLDAVDSESIADDFEIGTYTAKHDFANHLKVAIFEGVHPSDSLDELAEKTEIHEELRYMAGSTFSRLTNDRDYRAVVRRFFELLHSPQLYHQRGVQRKRLDWLERAVVATDATNLTLTRSIDILSESQETEIRRVIQPGEKGLHLNLAARVDGDAKHPLGVTISPGVMREPTQFDHLQSDVEVFADLNSPIHVFDRGYLDYERFCSLKERIRTSSVCSGRTHESTSWNTSKTSRSPMTRGHDTSPMNGLSLSRPAKNFAASSSRTSMVKNSRI